MKNLRFKITLLKQSLTAASGILLIAALYALVGKLFVILLVLIMFVLLAWHFAKAGVKQSPNDKQNNLNKSNNQANRFALLSPLIYLAGFVYGIIMIVSGELPLLIAPVLIVPLVVGVYQFRKIYLG